jgi:hypothetical protein
MVIKDEKAEGSMQEAGNPVEEELAEHFHCGLRKNQARIPVKVCHRKRCLFLESHEGKLGCSYRNYANPKKRK